MEVFCMLSHGSVVSAEVLGNRERSHVSIISMGTEGELTYLSPSYMYIHYLIHKHGKPFVSKLLSILMEKGLSYIDYRAQDQSDLETDIQTLFRINRRDLVDHPSNILRAYYGNDTILNMNLGSSMPDETLVATQKMTPKHRFPKKNQHTLMISMAGSSYRFSTESFNPTCSPGSMYMNLVQPLGLLQFGKDTFHLTHRCTTDAVPLRDVADTVRQVAGARRAILFLTCCKGYDKGIMMDFSPHPGIEKPVNEFSVVRMMQNMRLSTPTPTQKRIRTRKRPLPTPSPTQKRTHSRKKRRRTAMSQATIQ
jgi:hypothetical protein